MAEKMKGMGGLSKMGTEADKMPKPMAEPKEKPLGAKDEDGGGEKTHTLTEHGDGSMTSRMHDGTETKHPDHLHAMAHMAHHITGGDKHHMAHHDGMSTHSHSIDESGQHNETHENASPEEAGQELASAMGDGQGEPSDGGQQAEPQQPAYGGMSA
jgi:hypothetical protein